MRSLEVGMDIVHFSVLGGKQWSPATKSDSVLASWRFLHVHVDYPGLAHVLKGMCWHLYKYQSQKGTAGNAEMVVWEFILLREESLEIMPTKTAKYFNSVMQWFADHLKKTF